MKLVKDINKESSNKPQVSDKEAEEAIKKLLAWIGEDPSREGLQETPKRVVKAFKEYFKGYHQNAEEDLSKTKRGSVIRSLVAVSRVRLGIGEVSQLKC